MLKCLKNELLLLKTKRHCFDVGSIAHNVLQLYLVADFENENFKFRTNDNRSRKLE